MSRRSCMGRRCLGGGKLGLLVCVQVMPEVGWLQRNHEANQDHIQKLTTAIQNEADLLITASQVEQRDNMAVSNAGKPKATAPVHVPCVFARRCTLTSLPLSERGLLTSLCDLNNNRLLSQAEESPPVNVFSVEHLQLCFIVGECVLADGHDLLQRLRQAHYKEY